MKKNYILEWEAADFQFGRSVKVLGVFIPVETSSSASHFHTKNVNTYWYGVVWCVCVWFLCVVGACVVAAICCFVFSHESVHASRVMTRALRLREHSRGFKPQNRARLKPAKNSCTVLTLDEVRSDVLVERRNSSDKSILSLCGVRSRL